ncbi:MULTISPECIES: cell division protein SepF [unclassified Leptotrichia]|uniref:cell division protein SepF n=1 Tax=unclassified Leptotrichia TaxID=2633022 RepID=UPI0004064D21|nr:MULTISPECIES: cell division protein SepF [unclassified Leptotrichia]WLD74262.1 cell division protein SepF [Leptotrichia sp. HMT-225]
MGLKRKIMEFFGDDIEDDDDELSEELSNDERKEVAVEQQPVQTQQAKVQPKPAVNRVEQEKQPEEKKGIGSLFGVGKKEEITKMASSKVSYVSIIRPKVFEDSRLIADAIKENKVVTFSLEFLEYEVGQRVIDFVSGAAYAMNAHLSKVTDKVLTSIPVGIDYEDIDASLGEESRDSNLL